MLNCITHCSWVPEGCWQSSHSSRSIAGSWTAETLDGESRLWGNLADLWPAQSRHLILQTHWEGLCWGAVSRIWISQNEFQRLNQEETTEYFQSCYLLQSKWLHHHQGNLIKLKELLIFLCRLPNLPEWVLRTRLVGWEVIFSLIKLD